MITDVGIKCIFILPLFLSACESAGIKNDTLSDRVKACSAGFSVGTQANLHASLDKGNLSGGIDGGVKEETRSAIFSEMPEKDRHEVYHDYIRCIEKHWNGND